MTFQKAYHSLVFYLALKLTGSTDNPVPRTMASKPSWAAIVARPPPSPVEAHKTSSSSIIPERDPPAGSVITVRLKAEMGWIIGQTDEPTPRIFIPMELWFMFPHLRKRLFMHVFTTDNWPEPGGMFGVYARPGVTRKTYKFKEDTYIIDFTGLQVGDPSNCPACGGPMIKQYHRFRRD